MRQSYGSQFSSQKCGLAADIRELPVWGTKASITYCQQRNWEGVAAAASPTKDAGSSSRRGISQLKKQERDWPLSGTMQ